MRISTVNEMRECDRRAVEEYGLSEVVLMEHAGHSVYEVLKTEFDVMHHRFLVLCGRGNNGGDGMVVARKLHSRGAVVRVCLLADESEVQGTSRANYDAAIAAGMEVIRVRSAHDLPEVKSGDVMIDALLGTGLSRSPEGIYGEAIEWINGSGLPVVAVDIPSGVNGDNGLVPGAAVTASCTVTFGLPKRGNLLPPGREHCGKLIVTHISFPPELIKDVGGVEVSRPLPLPPRRLESHKGDYGDVLFVAGARSYLGAPMLVVMSFLRAGGGYGRLATPASLAPLVGSRASEAVMVPLAETSDGTLSLSNLDVLCQMGDRADMMVIGPGVSLHEETQELVRRLATLVKSPVILDGDGLSALASDPSCIRGRESASTVLTPHVGEMARLLGCTIEQIEADRVTAVIEAVHRFGAVVVLKGSSTLIGGPTGLVSLNLTGNPGMATAGSGDVLAGTIAAVYGMGLELRPAAETGVFIHGLAGDLAAEEIGEDGLVASEIMTHLPVAVRLYRQSFSQLTDNCCGRLNVI